MTSATASRRLCVTAAIAVVGAGVIIAPPAATPPDIEMPAVELTAGLLDPYVDLITNTIANLGSITTHWLEDPLPTLTQVIVNWFGYLDTTIDSFVAAGQSFIDGLMNLPDQLQTLFSALQAGDIEEAFAELVIIVLSIFPIPALVDRLLAIPYDIAGNFVSAALAALHALQVPVGLAALNSVQATIAEVELVVHDFVDDLQNGDFTGALVQLFQAPAQIFNATLNSEAPGLAGLLAPFQNVTQSGFVDALVNYLPRTVAQAIGALYAPINADPPPLAADLLGDAGNLNLELGDFDVDATSTLADVAP